MVSLTINDVFLIHLYFAILLRKDFRYLMEAYFFLDIKGTKLSLVNLVNLIIVNLRQFLLLIPTFKITGITY